MKKKLLTKFCTATLSLFSAMLALPAMAQEPYDLHVAGVQVTSANSNDLSTIEGVSATAKYDHSTKTLTLDNATIKTSGGIVVKSEIDGLTVVVKGQVKVESYSQGFSFSKPSTISGGTLNVVSKKQAGIYITRSGALIIKKSKVNVEGKWGISGYDGKKESLTIDNATITAKGNGEKPSICDLFALTLTNASIAQPAGAVWNAEKHAVCNAAGEPIKQKVEITATGASEPATYYNLWVAGKRVNSDNCGDLSVIDGVEGTVTYDPTTKNLTLKDATITNSGSGRYDYGIYSQVPGLTIVLKGTSTVKADLPAIGFNNEDVIRADEDEGGTLNAESAKQAAIYLPSKQLFIMNCTVNAKGNWGIAGYDGSLQEDLIISKSTVTAEGKYGSMCDLTSMLLDDCAIVEPVGADFNTAMHAVCDAQGKRVTTKVVIAIETESFNVVLPQSEGGAVDVTAKDGFMLDLTKVPNGTEIKMVAKANEGYLFEKMIVAIGSENKEFTETEATFAVTDNITITGVFKKDNAVGEVLNATAKIVAIYSVDGRSQEDLQEGVNIVRYSDGTIRKVLLSAKVAAEMNANR